METLKISSKDRDLLDLLHRNRASLDALMGVPAEVIEQASPPCDFRLAAGNTCPCCGCGIMRPWGEHTIACENCDHLERA